MARRTSSPVFIGRRPELERLEAALAEATGGEPQVLLVAGDAGVGKTRLVAEFSARAGGGRAGPGRRLRPRGRHGVAFAAVSEALRGLVRTLGRPGFEALAGPAGLSLCASCPTSPRLRRQPPSLRPVAGSRRACLSCCWVPRPTRCAIAGRGGGRGPALGGRGDPGPGRYLAQDLRDEEVLLVATYRTDDLHRRHPLMPLLAELRRSPRVEWIDLLPFDRDELAEQLQGILGREPEPALVAEIQVRSEGNAYLAEELAAVGPGVRLPSTVEDVLLARVGRLSQAAQDLLRVASSAGPRIDTAVLATVASRVDVDPSAAIREVVDEHVLVRRDEEPEERYAFRHALLGEAVYGELLPAERASYHEAYARALSEREGTLDPSTAAELAHHWEGAGDLPRAFGASVEAGRAAANVYAFGDAQRLFERALALWEKVPDAEMLAGMDRVDLLELAATASAAAGAFVRAVLHLRAAIDLVDETEDPVRAGLLEERLGRYAWDASEPAESLAATRDAVRLVPADPPTAARARVLGGLARSLALTGSVDEATTTARDAVAVASATGARDVEADALATLGAALGDLGAIRDAEIALAVGATRR
jgi:tetratricopeptide (TPR) repeat protein